jgi:hypothetical protein
MEWYMADTEDDLQQEVDNAVAGTTGDTAENDDETTSDGDTQEDTSASDSTEDNDSEDASDSTSNQEVDDDEDEDDDDTLVPFQQPGQTGKVPENFDIRTLPRDENGLIDPAAANKAIQDWADQRAQAQLAGVKTETQAREVLTNQWSKAKEKFPFLNQNKDLAVLTRDLHLNSITAAQNGTGRYLSPFAAAKKVNKMYSRAVKSGVAQQKTKQTVEHSVSTERPNGKGGSAVKSEYDKASEMAMSRDGKTAQEGRRKIMELRYNARHQ